VAAPVRLLNVPAGQFSHSRLLFLELFVPEGQKVQLIAPMPLYVPTAQSRQLRWPLWSLNVPARQALQLMAG
jgi:hypothetical protein